MRYWEPGWTRNPSGDIYLATSVKGAQTLIDKAITGCAEDPVPEIQTVGRTLGRWRTAILAHHTTGASNGPTEGLNLLIKKVKRAGHGFRSFAKYRLRILLHAGGVRNHRHDCYRRPSEATRHAETGRALNVLQRGRGAEAVGSQRESDVTVALGDASMGPRRGGRGQEAQRRRRASKTRLQRGHGAEAVGRPQRPTRSATILRALQRGHGA